MLILDDPSTWPEIVKNRLGEDDVVEVLRQNDSMDELVRHPVLKSMLEEIEK